MNCYEASDLITVDKYLHREIHALVERREKLIALL